VSNSFFTTAGFWMSRATSRRACRRFSSRRASVINFSAKERTSLAFGNVVRIRSFSNRAVARLRRSAIRWA